jgi:hypothetical protein
MVKGKNLLDLYLADVVASHLQLGAPYVMI